MERHDRIRDSDRVVDPALGQEEMSAGQAPASLVVADGGASPFSSLLACGRNSQARVPRGLLGQAPASVPVGLDLAGERSLSDTRVEFDFRVEFEFRDEFDFRDGPHEGLWLAS